MEQLLIFLQPLLETYAGNYGKAVQVIGIIGSLRIFVKPTMSLLLAYTDFTESKDDDAKLAKLKENKIYKGLVYALDWFSSIKINPKK